MVDFENKLNEVGIDFNWLLLCKLDEIASITKVSNLHLFNELAALSNSSGKRIKLRCNLFVEAEHKELQDLKVNFRVSLKEAKKYDYWIGVAYSLDLMFTGYLICLKTSFSLSACSQKSF